MIQKIKIIILTNTILSKIKKKKKKNKPKLVVNSTSLHYSKP